jgi:exodeoxyribonuclease V beta subunit
MADIDLPDRDAFADLLWHRPDHTAEWIEAGEPTDRANILMFPKGSRAGNFFHDIFEQLDYTTRSSATIKELVLKKLQAYGFENNWQQTIVDTIMHVLTVSLRPDQPDLTLSCIEFNKRVNEMEFYFPINPITPQKLQSLFKQQRNVDDNGNFTARLEKLVFAPAAGFMKGYMDLVFQHQGRFYLVDWKSNYLGPTPEDYNQRVLTQAMQENYYVLQYHFYALALCQYLRIRNSDFRYESDFGGVFYIFIRGIDSRHGPELGIYFDHPEATRINALGKALIPGFEELM